MSCSKDQIVDFLASHKESFAADFSVQRLGLFGSYARGEECEESDVDIVVELEKPDMYYLIGIKQAIEDALLTSLR